MLRLAEKKDKRDWIRLNREFMDFEIQDNNLWNNIDMAETEELAEVFEEALQRPENITIFMIEKDREVIGFANLMTIFSVWSEGYALVIDDLYITPKNQRKGYGRAVMKEIEDYALRNGYKRIQFQSEATNPGAKAFYTKLGYKPVNMSFYVRYIYTTKKETSWKK